MITGMYNDPYLETCCRAALHRLSLAGAAGRPAAEKDGPCLTRLAAKGFACEAISSEATGDRFILTPAGIARHASEILKQPLPAAPSST